jgi:hypothetical protein
MSMMSSMVADVQRSREFSPADCFPVWCRIEDLSDLCGYDTVAQFSLLRELPEAYPAAALQDPDGIAEEHPLQALAMLIRRFLAEYPEEAEILDAAERENEKTGHQPERAA